MQMWKTSQWICLVFHISRMWQFESEQMELSEKKAIVILPFVRLCMCVWERESGFLFHFLTNWLFRFYYWHTLNVILIFSAWNEKFARENFKICLFNHIWMNIVFRISCAWNSKCEVFSSCHSTKLLIIWKTFVCVEICK